MSSTPQQYDYLMRQAQEVGARTGFFLHSAWAENFLGEALAYSGLRPGLLVGTAPHETLQVLQLQDARSWQHLVDLMLIPTEHGNSEIEDLVISVRSAGCSMPICEVLPTTNNTGNDLIAPFLGVNYFITPKTHLPNHFANGDFIEFLTAQLKARGGPVRLLDMFSGQGVIGLSLYSRSPEVKTVTLAEINPEQVRSILNTLHLNAFPPDKVKVLCTDLFDGIPDNEQFDMIVGNPPHQDRMAQTIWDLQGADPGLNIHRRFFLQAGRRLAAGGRIYLIENRLLTSPEEMKTLAAEALQELRMLDTQAIHGTTWRIDTFSFRQ